MSLDTVGVENNEANYVALSARGQALDMNLQALASANNGESLFCGATAALMMVMLRIYIHRFCNSGHNDAERDGEPPQPSVLQNGEQDRDELRRDRKSVV